MKLENYESKSMKSSSLSEMIQKNKKTHVKYQFDFQLDSSHDLLKYM